VYKYLVAQQSWLLTSEARIILDHIGFSSLNKDLNTNIYVIYVIQFLT